ncbi:hypothetical protein [Nocardia macrotermitis]|uniref:hypothetical protein n=1 Tax=Nocardia macrotermitis TaxID=2585198 RepID=UPI001297B546|nr:hypothetical protein [Nocardia macrotermitis]
MDEDLPPISGQQFQQALEAVGLRFPTTGLVHLDRQPDCSGPVVVGRVPGRSSIGEVYRAGDAPEILRPDVLVVDPALVRLPCRIIPEIPVRQSNPAVIGMGWERGVHIGEVITELAP